MFLDCLSTHREPSHAQGKRADSMHKDLSPDLNLHFLGQRLPGCFTGNVPVKHKNYFERSLF